MATIENFTVKVKTEGAAAIKNLSNDVANLGTQFGGLNNTLGSFTTGLGVTASAVAAVTGAFAALGLRAVKLADDFQDLSDATGLSAGELMNLKQSMIAAGGNTESFAKATTKLSVAIGEAMGGNEQYQKSFQKLGVYVTDAGGKLRSTSDITQDVISKLADISDPAVRSAEAVKLLGKEAAKIDWTQVKAGKDAFTDENIKNLAAFQQRLDQMAATLEKGLINNFGQLAKSVNQFLAEYDVKGFDAFLNRLQVASLRLSGFGAEADKVRNQFKQDLQAKAETDAETQKLLKLSQTPGAAAVSRPQIAKGTFGATPEATLKAIAESAKRIAQDQADAQKEIELRGASDIEKINIEMRANIEKSVAEIQNKERLSQAQKAKETLASVAKFTEKAATDTAKVREDQERNINQLKQQYAQSNNALLGIEQTELQKVTDQIAQQPAKYKEIGDQLLKNAAAQDQIRKSIEETVRIRQVEKETSAIIDTRLTSAVASSIQQNMLKLQALGASKEELAILQAQIDAGRQSYDLATSVKGAYEARLITEGRIDELTKEQIKDAATYNNLLAQRTARIDEEKNSKIALAQLDKQLTESFAVGWSNAYSKYVESSKNASEQAQTYFSTFTRGFEDAFVKMVQTGKLSFKDLANSLIADFARIQAKKALLGIFDMGGANSQGQGFSFGTLFGSIGKIFGFANGGMPPVNRPSLVGERGPELFVPRTAGTIVPNEMLGGSSNVTNVTYSIQAVDASSFRTLLARDPEFIHNVAEQGRRQLPIRSRR